MNKKRCEQTPVANSEVSPNTYNHTNKEAHTLRWSIHSLTSDGYYSFNWRFSELHQVRSKHFFQNYFLLYFSSSAYYLEFHTAKVRVLINNPTIPFLFYIKIFTKSKANQILTVLEAFEL